MSSEGIELITSGSPVESQERDEWQSAVFTLMGHATSLYLEGKHDMPAWCYELAEKIARTHLDEATAQRVRQLAVQQRTMYGEQGENQGGQ